MFTLIIVFYLLNFVCSWLIFGCKAYCYVGALFSLHSKQSYIYVV
jgi:hypothetical protein